MTVTPVPRELKRAYSSDLRDEQARRTRRQIVAAAGDLYARDGFAATTVDAIAAAAGVSRKTVFTSVGGKVALLKLAYDYTLAGDDEPVPMIDRPDLQRIIAEPDPYAAITAYAAFVTEIARRIGPLYLALRGAAEVDAEARELYERWEAERRAVMRSGPVATFRRKKVLRRDLTTGEAADILSVLIAPSLHHQLVVEYGWKVDRFRAWLTRTMIEQLFEPGAAGS